MNATLEDRCIAEQAADWVERLKDPSAQGSAEFMRWVRRSPMHVREVLLAMTIDGELGRIDPDHGIDIGRLIAQAATTVVPIGERQGLEPRVGRRIWAHWPRIAGIGAVAILLAALGWFLGAMNGR